MLNSKRNALQDLCWTNCFSKAAFGLLKGCLGNQSKNVPTTKDHWDWPRAGIASLLSHSTHKEKEFAKKTLKQNEQTKKVSLSSQQQALARHLARQRVSFILISRLNMFSALTSVVWSTVTLQWAWLTAGVDEWSSRSLPGGVLSKPALQDCASLHSKCNWPPFQMPHVVLAITTKWKELINKVLFALKVSLTNSWLPLSTCDLILHNPVKHHWWDPLKIH